MFTSTTKVDIIELAEDAEAISLMLAFVYPVVRPFIDRISLLEKAMLLAHKYEIEGLAKTLEQTCNQQKTLICSNPVRVFRLAADYGFHETQTLAATLIGSGKLDLLGVDGLLQFSKEFPGLAHIVGVVGAQGARIRILETLLTESGSKKHLTWSTKDCLLCDSCREDSGHSMTEGWSMYYRPGWLNAWALRLRSLLTSHPLLDECDFLFRIEYISVLKESGGCSACIDKAFDRRTRFNEWSRTTRQHIAAERATLDVLYRP
ncbi:hypothetical protein FS749_012142 [Ceratobasidium sp. UAMH 11750]|nr:hypothetical protein FS749_012142 [Ceratobasidium sp. UAMH 11750]